MTSLSSIQHIFTVSVIKAIIDLLIPGQTPGIKEPLVDLYGKPELLFFGPDEGTADMMDWAACKRPHILHDICLLMDLVQCTLVRVVVKCGGNLSPQERVQPLLVVFHTTLMEWLRCRSDSTSLGYTNSLGWGKRTSLRCKPVALVCVYHQIPLWCG